MMNCKYYKCYFCSRSRQDYYDMRLFESFDFTDNPFSLYWLLDKYHNRQGVRFGNMIHWLKPTSHQKWVNYCKHHNYFLPTKDILDQIPYNQKQYQMWMNRTINLLYFQLYLPEIVGRNVISKLFKVDVSLNYESKLDSKYGLDLYFYNEKFNKKHNFVAIKWNIKSLNQPRKIQDRWGDFKYQVFNNRNSNLYLWDYFTNTLYLYDIETNDFKELPTNKVTNWLDQIKAQQGTYQRFLKYL